MKGLLLKDFYIIKEGIVILILTFIGVGSGLSVVISPWVLLVIAATMLSMTAGTTIQNDKTTKWDQFSVTLPISRKTVISSKYCMYLLLCITGISLGIIVCCVASVIKGNFDFDSLILYTCLGVTVSLFPGSINIPCSYLFDEEKSMIGLLVSYIITSGIVAGIIFILNQFLDIKEKMSIVLVIIMGVSIIVFLISWIILPKWLCKKDIV